MAEGIYAVTVPKWGIEMQEGTVVSWHVEEGGDIEKGDELIDLETDKIVNSMEAPVSGVLQRKLAGKDETLSVGALLGVIGPRDVSKEAIDDFIAAFKPADTTTGSGEEHPLADVRKSATGPPPLPPETALGETSARRVRVSPAAAQRAKELGVDISQVKTSGRRITPQDVERHALEHSGSEKDEAADTGYESIPLSSMRKTIARRLVDAKQQIPHFYLSIDIAMDAALARREEINQGSQIVSINDVVLRAVVLALQSVPDINIHLVNDEIRRFRHVNLAIAVATERGLITPVIGKAEEKSLLELAKEAAELGERARNASLTREELENGTFTVSNLGMFGISEFQAIIDPPQCAILAVGACENRVVAENDKFTNARVMRVTVSCDHRAVDGALGAQFLSELKAILESREIL